MCSGSNNKLSPSKSIMEGVIEKQKGSSILLEFASTDDLIGFKRVIEEKGFDVDESSSWYGRRIGSRKMGFEERTPLMIASMLGSIRVLKFIIETKSVDVNRSCGSDGVTALHCAASGGSDSSLEVVMLLLDASADLNSLDSNGNKPGDVIPPCLKSSCNSRRKSLEILLKGVSDIVVDDKPSKEEVEKKEFPIDVSLPDINNGVYGTDEFRMYTFKVKPCSRAYSHDWTECPFVHPGENARRRDPRKYNYSCVPCPEFRKGSCQQGDNCEYAHGVFECWLHPAQYRTRLCKDETGCARKVCFFAHKVEELRPLYASTGSAMPSPTSMKEFSTPPMSPSSVSSSPTWQGKPNVAPPALHLPGSRLKSSLSARDMGLDMEFLGLEGTGHYSRLGELKPTNLDDLFGSLDPTLLAQLQGFPMKSTTPQLKSPSGFQIRQNMNQIRSRPPTNPTSFGFDSSASMASSFAFDSSAAVAAAVMNSRSSAFAKRSQSFIDRAPLTHQAANHSPLMSPNFSNWGSPDGKLDWAINGEELNKLKKSASFNFRSNNASTMLGLMPPSLDEPDVSWVNSLVKDVPLTRTIGFLGSEQQQYHLGGGVHDMLPPWAEQMYIEQEQMVA